MLVAAIAQSGHADPIVRIVRKAWNESLVPSVDSEVIAEEAVESNDRQLAD
jgi:hypothetical protein